MSVLAGVVVDVSIVARFTLTDMSGHLGSSAGSNTFDSKMLPFGEVTYFCILRKKTVKYILNGSISPHAFSSCLSF